MTELDAAGTGTREEAIALLRRTARQRAGDLTLSGADLRDADLAGARLAFVNLADARLDGADLSGARLDQVVLTGASLRGARLIGAEVSLTEATGAAFDECDAVGSTWRQSTMIRAGFRGARLVDATFLACRLETAVLARADLGRGSLLGCWCDGADLSGADAAGLEALGSTFRDADLGGTRSFAMCRELVGEVLRRHLDPDDQELTMLAASVVSLKRWCWSDWKAYLSTPDFARHRSLAAEVFARYPASGTSEAFEEGRPWRR